MNIDERQIKRLHYDVMGIALAIRGHAGENMLFQEMDRAISALDWRKMAIMQRAFDMLSDERRSFILSDNDGDEQAAGSIVMFERNLRTMIPLADTKTA